MASKMTKRMSLMLIAVLLLIGVLALFKFLQIRKMIANIPKPQAQVVTTMKAATLEWQPQTEAVGTLVAVRGVDVSSEIAGQVREVRFQSGQDVKAGQVLVQLNADSDVALQQSLQAAVDLAGTVLARDRQQLAVKAIAQAQLDADEADLRVKKANLAQQAATVAKKTIRAPFAGRVGITTVNPGQYLAPGDRIVTLQTLDPIHFDFSLPQAQLAALQIGQHVTLASDGRPGASYVGKLAAISPKVDPATRNLALRATVANPKRDLLPGMFARIEIDTGAPARRLTVPQTAITYNPYGSTVFVVEPGEPLKVKQVFVTTGATRGDQVAITSGIKEGDQIVTSGQVKLKNGTEVKIDNSVVPANSPNPTPQEN
ncbi:MAG: efflux RND transporter periplasmic adaptor subunit [Burkholderiales bacterium]|nr:efflux RND transporter periplasmic adaptor subunit [Burkholderiales bacterium]